MKALILVDIQNDFLSGGALPVPEGDQVVPLANRLQPCFELVIATQDWHPRNHGSFAVNHPNKRPGEVIELNGLPQILWPVHCVQDSYGAEFAPNLDRSKWNRIFTKGTDPAIDSYSGFFDNGHQKETGLKNYLLEKKIKEVYIVGLATDYCVKFTALDALTLGFQTYIIKDVCRGVKLVSGDVDRAVDEMKKAGVHIVNFVNITS